MAYKAGSVIVEIMAKADALRKTFGDAKSAVNDFGAQVATADKSVKGLGRSLKDNLAEPKSVFGWLNKLSNSLKEIDYVAGRGIVRKTLKQTTDDLARANSSAASTSRQLASATDADTAATNRNADAKNKKANASRRAQMADLDLIFAAMYAQMAFAGMVSKIKETVTEGNKATNAMLGLESVIRSMGGSVDTGKQVFQSFREDGLMNDREIAESIKNLLLVGYSLDQASAMMNRFKDTAAFGRQASLGFGEAIVKTTEGVRLGLSTLSDGAGMAKNLGQILKENGYTEQDLTRITTDAGVRQALYNGILKETAYAAGDAKTLTEGFSGSLAKLNTQATLFDSAVGRSLSGILNAIAKAITPIIAAMTRWIDEHPKLTAVIITVTVTMLALISAMLMFQFIAPMLGKAIKELVGIIKFMTSPVGLVIAAVIALGMIIAANKDLIVDAVKYLYDSWMWYFERMWDYLKEFARGAGNLMTGMGRIIAGAMSFDKDLMASGLDYLKEGWEQVARSAKSGARATAEVVNQSLNTIRMLDPVTLIKNTWDKLQGIFEPVKVDLSNKQATPRTDSPDDGKDKKGAKGPSPYQVAMRAYEHKIHMEELVEYEDKKRALIEIGETVVMTAEEQMDYSERVFDLVKKNIEDEKRYKAELMDYDVRTGKATLNQKLALLKEQLKAEKDRFNQLRIMNEIFATEVENTNKTADKEIKSVLDTWGPSSKKSLREIIKELETLAKKYEAMGEAGKEAAQKARDAIKNVSSVTEEWVDKFSEGLAQVMMRGQTLGAFINKMLADIAAAFLKYQIQKLLGNLLEGVFGAMPWLGGTKATPVTVKGGQTGNPHQGGIIGKYHTGGVIGGLQNDERLIVGQTGERVLSRRDTALFDAAMASAGGSNGPKVVNNFHIQAMDAMSFSQFAQKNAGIFGAAIAQDYSDNGVTKKMFR